MVFGCVSSAIQYAKPHMWGTRAWDIILYEEWSTVSTKIGEKLRSMVGAENLFILIISSSLWTGTRAEIGIAL